MIRATAGVWLNYATTFAFQVLFATRYGSGREASAFVITFTIVIAVSGIVGGVAHSIVLPRLLTTDNALARQPLRLLFLVASGGVLILVALASVAPPVGGVVANGVSANLVTSLAVPAAVFGALQVVAGAAIVASLARGKRFTASVAPAAPSILGIAYLALNHDPGLRALYLVLAGGSILEVVFILGTAGLWLPVRRTAEERLTRLTAATILQFTIFGSVAPLERVASSWKNPAGAADYNYAIRSIASVQQLLIGGVLMSAGPDWAELARVNSRERLSRSVAARTSVAALALVLIAVLGALLARTLVALVYQHGSFTSRDTRAVATLLVLALPGFFADGVAQVLSQSLVAVRANRALVEIGLVSFMARVMLIVLLSAVAGARGVAVAYTAAAGLSLLMTAFAVHRAHVIDATDARLLVRAAAVGGAMALVAAGAATLSAPALAKAGLALAAFAALLMVARLPSQFAGYGRGTT